MSVRHVSILMLAATVACAGDAPAPTRAPAPTSSRPVAQTPTATPTPDPFALARSYESEDPIELADRLIVAEQAISAGTTDVTKHARVQQAAYRQLVVTPGWREQVFARLPDALREVARSNVEAGADLRALTQPRTELPPWRIVDPPVAADLRGYYEDAEQTFGIDWSYLAAIHLVETRMGRIRGTSTAGAKGPMQFLPSTWARWGKGDIEDPKDAILAAGRYLKGHGAPADMAGALFAYNHSDHYVRAISLYSEVMRHNVHAYAAYHAWQVYYRTTKGDALLYEGWPTR